MRICLTLGCALALAACASTDPGSIAADRHRKDAGVTVVDAPPTSTGGNTVTCYSEGSPAATCTLPVHCCFDDYSSQHNGGCTTSACIYGEITCDGPEDCGAGQVCCAHPTNDPIDGTIGYLLACHSGGCAAGDWEICHPTTGCSTGASCVTAYGNQNDLPRTLYVCQ